MISRPGIRLALAAPLAIVFAAGLVISSPAPVQGAVTFVVNRIGDQPDLNLANAACDTSTNSGNQCTLRAAIQEANDTPGADTINFNITSTSKVIAPATPLPPITEQVTINGYSQANASVNTRATGNNAVLKVVLDGINAGEDVDGLVVQADNSVVRGLVVQRFDRVGILVSGAANVIAGNLVGTNAAGTEARGNQTGIKVTGSQNVIGGTARAARNLISGNRGYGLNLEAAGATGNLVQGNYIGTNKGGTARVGNGDHGVAVVNAPDNTIGGTTAGARNVISGNQTGVTLHGPVGGNVIAGNYIGVNAAGTAAVPNTYRGITARDAINPIIGGTVAGSRNVISGNNLDGVELAFVQGATVQGNLIGTQADGTGDLGNGRYGVIMLADDVVVGGAGAAANVISGSGEMGVRIQYGSLGNQILGNVIRQNDLSGVYVLGDETTVGGNLIFQNAGDGVEVHPQAQGTRITGNQIYNSGQLGIDLVGGTENAAGVTSNDVDDPDTGANDRQNFPVLTSAVRSNISGTTTVIGTLNSNPSTEFRIELFLAVADPSGHGEGQVPLAAQNVTTNANGDASFAFGSGAWSQGMVLTATATSTSAGNTSEFSANRTVTVGP